MAVECRVGVGRGCDGVVVVVGLNGFDARVLIDIHFFDLVVILKLCENSPQILIDLEAFEYCWLPTRERLMLST